MRYTGLFISILIQLALCKFRVGMRANGIEQQVIQSMRALKALEMIRTKSCRMLIAAEDCSALKRRAPHEMHVFMATRMNSRSELNLRLVRKNRDLFKKLHSVVVVDPFPEAHFGHTILVLLIREDLTQKECERKNGIYFLQVNRKTECIYLPDSSKCLRRNKFFMLKNKRSRTCSINNIPFVYDKSDVHRKSRLECMSNIQGFGICPIVDLEKPESRCKNSQRCTFGREFGRPKSPCHWNCDYAVLLSGGWNKYMNKPRHLRNIHGMYNYLRNKGRYRKENIKIFFANNATIDLDGDPNTQDTYPATESTGVMNHIEHICRKSRQCIDTFVLYLNGPTLKNKGDLLLWDHNADGSYSDTETIKLNELLAPLRRCGAKNYIIIADQNYAGRIIRLVKKGRLAGYRNFNKIHVITASSEMSYSWKSSFTENFILHDNVNMDSPFERASTRRIADIYKDTKRKLSKKFHMRYLPGINTNLTITGGFGQTPGCSSITLPKLKGDLIARKSRKKRSLVGT